MREVLIFLVLGCCIAIFIKMFSFVLGEDDE